jgi:hypothetical protein
MQLNSSQKVGLGMTKKPSLLLPETIMILRECQLDPLLSEFFGTVSGMAQALNKSTNAYKAACTMLDRPRTIEMLAAFLDRKANPRGETTIPDEVQTMVNGFRVSQERQRDDERFARQIEYSQGVEQDYAPGFCPDSCRKVEGVFS